MKQILRKIMVLTLAMVMVAGAFMAMGEVHVSAKTVTPGKPKAKVKALKNNSGIKVTVNKTKNADGYKVYVEFGSDESLYTIDEKPVCEDNLSFYAKNVATIDKDGTKKRSVSIKASDILGGDFETLCPGFYYVTVKAYKKDENGKLTYGKLSKEVKYVMAVDTEAARGSVEYSIEDLAGLEQGDIVKFGAYEQDCNFNNGPEPIEWIVLSKNDSKIVLFSRYALDRLPYNNERGKCIWKVSSIRKWLNRRFYNVAFDDTEKALITTVTNENTYYLTSDKTIPGTNTDDKVFLLSKDEITNEDYGFNNDAKDEDEIRAFTCTKYAAVRGADTRYGEYWLRTVGEDGYDHTACTVENDGYLSSDGASVYDDYEYDDDEDYGLDITYGYSVRPAIVIDLENPGDDNWEEFYDDEWAEEDYWEGFDKSSYDDDEDDD